MTELVLIAHNLRSSHNVGSLLRTAEGVGVGKVWLTGYSPYPLSIQDERLPHLGRRTDAQITKTALGAEKLVTWEHTVDIKKVLTDLKAAGFTVAGLEQSPAARRLPDYKPPQKLALIVGREVEGMEPEIAALCDLILEIPMSGRKESFNVVQAAAMALYHVRFIGPKL
jgi:23S rRNA (guanosine2251-2'-O)-methyltransferase